MMHRFFLHMLLLLSLSATAQNEGFQARTFQTEKGTLNYQYLSPISSAAAPLPAIIFLHGSGERGSDNTLQLKHGSSLFLDKKNRKKFPAHVFFPQCPLSEKWVNFPYATPLYAAENELTTSMQLVMQLMDSLKNNPQIDARRIYVMGLSMGGFATWQAAFYRPDAIAALVPICGGGDVSKAATFAHIPVWIFHGEKDDVIPVKHSKDMFAATHQALGKKFNKNHWRITLYPDANHNSWENAFGEKQLLKWLFRQHK